MRTPAIVSEQIASASRDEKLAMLREVLPILDSRSRLALHYRFWESMTIEEISKRLCLSWDEANRLIEESIAHLRAMFFERQAKKIQSAA